MSDLLDKISVFESKAGQLEERLADPSIASAPAEYASVAKELSRIRPLVEAGARYRQLLADIEDANAMLEDDDAEMRELAETELAELEEQQGAIEREIRLLLVPKDPDEEKNAILEIRAGTGGDEAALFAADLFRMYSRYAEARGWKIEPISISQTDGGGIREAIVDLEGKEAFGRLRYECGVHRVQRVPSTESQGRIHTSTVTVAVLPEAKEVDIEPSASRTCLRVSSCNARMKSPSTRTRRRRSRCSARGSTTWNFSEKLKIGQANVEPRSERASVPKRFGPTIIRRRV